jgi:RNA polymerase sigma-70 factor (ECF subfamily)
MGLLPDGAIDRFCSRAAGARAEDEGLRALLEQKYAEALAGSPEVEVPPEVWVDALSSVEQLRSVHAADLRVACGCLKHEPKALQRLDALLAEEGRAAGRATRAAPDQVESVVQALRASLIAGEDGPALAGYAGRGSLRGFLRIAAVRALVREAQFLRRAAPEDELQMLPSELDPELERFKALYRDDLIRCFRTALTELNARDRAVLRMNVFEKLSIDRIGALFGVHRATAARWLERIRTELASRTEDLLLDQLGASESEVASIIRMVRRQVDVSIERILSGI